jgi:hypothetical protein
VIFCFSLFFKNVCRKVRRENENPKRVHARECSTNFFENLKRARVLVCHVRTVERTRRMRPPRPAVHDASMGSLHRFLLYGVCNRPARSVVPLFLIFGMAVLAYAFISPMMPMILKTNVHVDMCPNITAVTNSSLSPSNSGYALKAVKDSLNGVLR